MIRTYSFTLIWFCIIFHCINLKGQSFDTFLETRGMEVIALGAHPLLRLDTTNSKVVIFHNAVAYYLKYYGGTQTNLVLSLDKGIPVEIEAVETNSFVRPFQTARRREWSYGIATEDVRDSLQKRVRLYYENLFGKKSRSFTGSELTLCLVSYSWEKYLETYILPEISTVTGANYGDPYSVTTDGGIVVRGPKDFVNKILNSLAIIKEYDKYFFDTYLSSRRIFSGIVLNSYYAHTIEDNNYISLTSNHHRYEHVNNLSYYDYAGIIVHEVTHLYQYNEYRQLFDVTIGGYYFGYSYDPCEIANKEINAYEVQLNFLMKIPQSPDINRIRDEMKTRIEVYKSAREAGLLMFYDRFSEIGEIAKCGDTCKEQGCKLIDNFYKFFNGSKQAETLKKLICE